MNYSDLLDSHKRFNTTKNDIAARNGFDRILENVVIAPMWNHSIFSQSDFEVEQISDIVYNFTSSNLSFSYIEAGLIGAPAIMEYVLSLGVTNCKNLVFIGSCGSLDKDIKIGDLVIPEYSICGDGASRYLNPNLEDEFLKHEYPTKAFTNKLISILKKEKIDYHYVPNFSIDTVIAQYYHIDKILELGAKTIEMETANLFKCNDLLKINVTALFCVSDNTVVNKSLFSGRTEEEREHRHKVRNEIIPNIIIKLFKSMR